MKRLFVHGAARVYLAPTDAGFEVARFDNGVQTRHAVEQDREAATARFKEFMAPAQT